METAYAFNQEDLERYDGKRAEALRLAINERERELEEKKVERGSIYDVSLVAAENGANNFTIQAIQNATTVEEALRIASEAGVYEVDTTLQEDVIGGFRVLRDATGKVISTRAVQNKDKDTSDASVEQGLSPTAENVIDGVVDLDSLTPTKREEVTAELRTFGLYDEKPPEWYRELLEEQSMQSLLPEVVQEEWNAYRSKITGEYPSSTSAGEMSESSLRARAEAGGYDFDALVSQFSLEEIDEALTDAGF